MVSRHAGPAALRLVRKEAEEALGPGRAAVRLQVPTVFRCCLVACGGRATCTNVVVLSHAHLGRVQVALSMTGAAKMSHMLLRTRPYAAGVP